MKLFNYIGIKLKVTAYIILVAGTALSLIFWLSISNAYEQISRIKSFWMLIISVIGGLVITVIFSFCVYALGKVAEFTEQNYNLLRRGAKSGKIIVSNEINKY
jgi:hypothetical protein